MEAKAAVKVAVWIKGEISNSRSRGLSIIPPAPRVLFVLETSLDSSLPLPAFSSSLGTSLDPDPPL